MWYVCFNSRTVSSPDPHSLGRGQPYWSSYRYDFTPPLNVYRIARRYLFHTVFKNKQGEEKKRMRSAFLFLGGRGSPISLSYEKVGFPKSKFVSLSVLTLVWLVKMLLQFFTLK